MNSTFWCVVLDGGKEWRLWVLRSPRCRAWEGGDSLGNNRRHRGILQHEWDAGHPWTVYLRACVGRPRNEPVAAAARAQSSLLDHPLIGTALAAARCSITGGLCVAVRRDILLQTPGRLFVPHVSIPSSDPSRKSASSFSSSLSFSLFNKLTCAAWFI